MEVLCLILDWKYWSAMEINGLENKYMLVFCTCINTINCKQAENSANLRFPLKEMFAKEKKYQWCFSLCQKSYDERQKRNIF